MVFPIAGGTQDTGYDVSNSVRLNDDDNAQLDRTFGSGGDVDKFTVSMWIKISTLASQPDAAHYPFIAVNSSPGSNMGFRIRNTDLLQWYHYSAVDGDAGYKLDLRTAMLFRDPTAWYHIVGVYDSANGTEALRGRMYVNGVEAPLTGTPVYPSSGLDGIMGGQIPHSIGGYTTSGGQSDIYVAEMNYVDGQALAPTSFGEFDDNGVWIPKKYTGSYGTVGFFLQFKQTGTSANSSGIGADTSGNDNHFTPVGLAAADITEDTCTNNFCTLNPLLKSTSNVVLSEGNLKVVLNQTSGWQHAAGTIAVKSGKFYWEAKALNVSATDKTSIGVLQFNTTDVDFIGNTNTDRSSKGISGHGAGTGSYSYAEGDIIQCAMDLDNNKIYWGKNGTYFGTLNPANGSGSTTQTIDNANFCVPVVGGYADSSWEMNFGVPQFSISSGNSDGEYGNFEYAPPSGFYALCTKRIAEFG
tara:strand:- start:1179 stop:2585 length:1407 start_codon:yes stop_codon:yes gene_type:complete